MKKTAKKTTTKSGPSLLNKFFDHVATLRSRALNDIITPGRNINFECGYPDGIVTQDYKNLFDREGLAARVVSILPQESWARSPEVYENVSPVDTEFEKAWKLLVQEKNILHYLQRVDILSGLGRFGILLLGFTDGRSLEKAVPGIDLLTGKAIEGHTKKFELAYMKPFDETSVVVKKKESNTASPRYGKPTEYEIQFENTTGTPDTTKTNTNKKIVHWTRVLHLADNRTDSDIFGKPRMMDIYNRLLDVRKILSGSGEMFWKGAFPGHVFEVSPDQIDATIDTASLKEEFANYSDGLQRFLAVSGVTAKSLQLQVADPKNHLDAQLRFIAFTLGIPYRIFLGAEEAKLASSQDMKTWNKRLNGRQNNYLTPMVIRPLIERLMIVGALPSVESYSIKWPDLDSPSDLDKAKVGESRTKAMANYVTSGVDALMPPEEYFKKILGFSQEDVDSIMESAEGYEPPDVPEEDEE
jgi:uncharacterized protein